MARLPLFILLVFGIATLAAQLQPRDNSVCAQWCAANFAHPGKDCTSLAAHGKGPCYDCGPLSTSPSKILCQGACIDSSSNNGNCGSCGNVCSSPTTCLSGTCSCGGSLTNCGGTCLDVTSDNENCGSCGNVCPGGTTCVSGTCSCPGSLTYCFGTCIDTSNDHYHCGSCYNICGTGTDCKNGVCTLRSGSCNNPGYCGNFQQYSDPSCGPSGFCICGFDRNEIPTCVQGNPSCSNPACATNAECGPGETCFISSCCGHNICVPLGTGCANS